MCITFFRLNSLVGSGPYRLILIANRDEFYNRKTKASDYWKDNQDVLGGLDLSLEPHGTWLAAAKKGKIGALLNIQECRNSSKEVESRGALVSNYVRGDTRAEDYIRDIRNSTKLFDGYHLVLFELTPESIRTHAVTNFAKKTDVTELFDGIHGLSNSPITRPYKKVLYGKQKFEEIIAQHNTLEQKESLVTELKKLLQSRVRSGAESKDSPNKNTRDFLQAVFGKRNPHILRNTPKNSVDYDKLEAAIKEIQKVMTYINEDKKRTEGQVALFDIFNEIDKCPADLVSSHRCFISRCEVTELSDDLSGKGNPLVLFLFSDVIEVCKKRAKAFSKENNSTASSRHGHIKSYKHVEVIPLSAIVKVIDIKETDDCHNIFALIVKRSHDTKEAEDCVFSFTITDNTVVDKSKYLRSLCNQIANIVCATDTESYLMQLEPQQLDIDSSDVNTGTLGKAFNKFASKTRVKVGRALSFNKTPSKLRRAMSTMMSPFGSQNGLTPSSQLANLQLAALPPIPNYGDDPNTPTNLRKNKSASFTMGTSLRRL